MIKSPLCELLGIRHPILLAGMSKVSNPELAAAVSYSLGTLENCSLLFSGDKCWWTWSYWRSYEIAEAAASRNPAFKILAR